jgi:hypothetical protein
MRIVFEELKNFGSLKLDKKYLFYKINRFLTEKKYAGSIIDGLWYDYFDEANQYEVSCRPGIKPESSVYFRTTNRGFISLYLKVLKNRKINAYLYVDDLELAEHPCVIKEFQIELYKLLEM